MESTLIIVFYLIYNVILWSILKTNNVNSDCITEKKKKKKRKGTCAHMAKSISFINIYKLFSFESITFPNNSFQRGHTLGC